MHRVLRSAFVLSLLTALATACVPPALQTRVNHRLACNAKHTTIDFSRETDDGEVLTFCCHYRRNPFSTDEGSCVTYFCPRDKPAEACVEDT